MTHWSTPELAQRMHLATARPRIEATQARLIALRTGPRWSREKWRQRRAAYLLETGRLDDYEREFMR